MALVANPPVQPATPCFADRRDQSRLTPVMGLLWLLSAGLIALDGFDFFIIGVALPFLQRDFGLGPAQVGAIAIAALAGSLVGSLTLGPLTDRVGRQRMLLVDVALFVVATTGTVLAWNVASLVLFRFLVGVAIGADYPISVAYITENVPARWRGRMVIGAFTFQAIGALLGAVTGWLVIASFQAIDPDAVELAIHLAWRWMLGVGLVGAIAVALLRFRFQLESPLYYIAQGEYENASRAATLLLGEPITISPETEPAEPTSGLSYGALFSPLYRRTTLFASLPWFLQDIATYGVGIFTPTIIGTLAFALEDGFLERELASSRGAALVDLCLIAGFLLAVGLVDRVGRVRLQMLGFLGMALGLGVLALSDSLPGEQGWKIGGVFLGFFVFNLMMNAGPNATTFLLSGEVFPPAIRASGAGLAGAIAKAGAILGTFTLPILQATTGVVPVLLILALCCVLAALLTYALAPNPEDGDTDRGRSRELMPTTTKEMGVGIGQDTAEEKDLERQKDPQQ